MEEWKEYKLGEIVNILDYKRVPLSSKERSKRKGHYPYYGAQGIIDYIDDYIFDGTYLLIAEDGENLKSQKQNVAQLASGKYWVNNHAHIVESNGKSDIRYICYLLNMMDLSGYITGSAQPKLNQANLTSISLQLPSLGTQKKIADFLSVFDDIIEVNRRIKDNLEQQAQALFKSWFVDFEPFRDQPFVESELGMIPEGWRVVSFKDFIEVSTEKAPVDCYPEYSVTNKGIIPRNTKFNKKLSKSSSKNKVLKKNDLVFGMSREILNWGIMEDEVGGVSSAYNVYKIDKGIVSPTYLRLYMKARISDFNSLIGTAAREGQSLDKGQLLQKQIYIPTIAALQDFLDLFLPITETQLNYLEESRRLAELRDTLLPRLMSGEIKVGDVTL